MTKKPALAVVAALASGCVIEDKSPTGTSASADLNLLLLVVDRSGTIRDTFERKVDVYIDLRKLDAAKAVTAQDFAFQVVDAMGALLSEDDLACRRFHISPEGFIDHVYSAAPGNDAACVHMFAGSSEEHLLPNLMPFAGDSMRFTIHVAPLATSARDGGFADSLAASFTIEPYRATCGNGVVDVGEQCDDANQNDSDDCRNDCTRAPPPGSVCGNGILETGEQCDDGNQVDNDSCHNDCSPAVCGNGIVEADEQCDDGNHDNDDGCRNNCTERHDD